MVMPTITVYIEDNWII
ncbi:hypothetical protein VTN00DRAFT_5205 [Thermoascus crustaceus]